MASVPEWLTISAGERIWGLEVVPPVSPGWVCGGPSESFAGFSPLLFTRPVFHLLPVRCHFLSPSPVSSECFWPQRGLLPSHTQSLPQSSSSRCLNSHVSKDSGQQMADKHVENCSTSSAPGGIEIKTTGDTTWHPGLGREEQGVAAGGRGILTGVMTMLWNLW